MKELREYQQSEAYKMCTEKIQEKKIKKGELWEQWLPGSSQVLPEPFRDVRLAPGVTSFLPCRGRGCGGCEHPPQRAPAQGKALSALPVCGETGTSHCWAGCRAGWAEGVLGLGDPGSWRGGRQSIAVLPLHLPGRASPRIVPAPTSAWPQGAGVPSGSLSPAQPNPSFLSLRLVNAATPSPLLMCPSSQRSSWTKTRVGAWEGPWEACMEGPGPGWGTELLGRAVCGTGLGFGMRGAGVCP